MIVEGRRKRERGDLHLHLHLHTPQQASLSQPGRHGTFPVTGGGSRPHIAVNQSDCCYLRNPHFPAGSSCSQMLCAKQGWWEIMFHMLRIPQFEVVTVQTMLRRCGEVWRPRIQPEAVFQANIISARLKLHLRLFLYELLLKQKMSFNVNKTRKHHISCVS